ncbi:Tim44/TimA family putative adaptor protein [uncultured Algimonas sp.]|uniref:Tim44/TimA family putative adaptor protein n=1 Tax=uncultured Algimonas sp. TaxID=1547920 RepID=UPI0026390168|nr:Tim44/TimA family putative adaptor protein [uncultured Algimonas sp.]
MFEVVLYAAIAAIICVAFYSVLGKSVGRGPEDAFKPDEVFGGRSGEPDRDAGPAFAGADDAEDETGLSAIARAEPDFSPARFIDGAKTAYSMILEAFASGDRDTLRDLLTDEVYAVYDGAIAEREALSLIQVTDLGRLRTSQIKSARIEDGIAYIRVLYEADIASALRDASGELVDGDPDILASISEFWTFERPVGSSDPAWRLSEVEPSEGDALPADPTPDTTGTSGETD